MRQGKVKNKNDDKGYGFVRAGDADYFFHSSQCLTPFDDLIIGDSVEFNVVDSPKGKRATDVEKIR